jgi:hypothetical protein
MNLPPSMRSKIHIGMHVASFCDGGMASQRVLADELLDLWHNPICVDNVNYYVVVSQTLFDGPGRSSYMQLRATTSFDGCGLCDVDSRPFGKRRAYDSFRRYTKPKDTRRQKGGVANVVRDPITGTTTQLQYPIREVRPNPVNRYVGCCLQNDAECCNLLHMMQNVA